MQACGLVLYQDLRRPTVQDLVSFQSLRSKSCLLPWMSLKAPLSGEPYLLKRIGDFLQDLSKSSHQIHVDGVGDPKKRSQKTISILLEQHICSWHRSAQLFEVDVSACNNDQTLFTTLKQIIQTRTRSPSKWSRIFKPIDLDLVNVSCSSGPCIGNLNSC